MGSSFTIFFSYYDIPIYVLVTYTYWVTMHIAFVKIELRLIVLFVLPILYFDSPSLVFDLVSVY